RWRIVRLLAAAPLLSGLGPGRAEQLATRSGVLPRRLVAGQQSRLPRPGRLQPPDAVDLSQLFGPSRVHPRARRRTPAWGPLATPAAGSGTGAALPRRPLPEAQARASRASSIAHLARAGQGGFAGPFQDQTGNGRSSGTSSGDRG